MKKILTVLLSAMMIASFTACSSETPAESEAPASEASSEAPASEEAADAAYTAVEGTLTMATNAQFPPYEFYQGDQIVGIDAEIAGLIADKLGLELVIEDMEFGSIINSIKLGKADIGAAGMTVTPERLEEVNFTESYATGVQVIIVKEDSPITSVDDLFADGANHTVGVQLSTTGDIYASGDIEDAGLGTMDRYNKGADAVMALSTDKVDCVIIDSEPAKAFVASIEGLKILDTEYITENYAIAMNKENTALYEDVNAAVKELIADGSIQAVIDKYITAE